MKILPRLLYFACFLALAIVTALALDRAFSPSVSSVLVRTIVAATLCAAPGLVWRRLWPLPVLFLPLGCYLLMRTVVPLPISVEGLGAHFAFYAEQLQAGASSFKVAAYPLPSARDPGLVLFVTFCAYWIVGATAFLALSMRRPLISMVLLLAVVYVPFLNVIFDTVPLGWAQWQVMLPLLLVPSVAAEVVKYIISSKRRSS